MSAEQSNSPELNQRLDEIIAEHLQSKSDGELNRTHLLQSYPHLEKALRARLDELEQQSQEESTDISSLTQLQEANHKPDLPTNREGARLQYFGDYEILEEIARGGMGVVYKARQSKLNRIVAVKMILAGQLASKRQIKRFMVEAESAANLHHPGIVPVYEFGVHEGTHYFSMAFVDGECLANKVGTQPLKPREAAEIVVKVTQAMAYAHSHGVIHRDLKPANILLDENGEPKITDFGLAKRIEDDSQLTRTGAVMGSVFYMSPEQAAGEIHRIGPATDIYSLGAVLYELLTGRPPFQAATAIETIKQVGTTDPVPPGRLNPAIPRDLDTICLKCLEKEPDNRYATASALQEDLIRFLEGRPIQARPIGRVAHLWRWCCRNPLSAGLGIGLGLVLLAGIIIATTLWNQAQAEKERSEEHQSTVKKLSHMVIRETLDETDAWLRQFFQPVQQELLVARAWGKSGWLKTDRPQQLNELLGPLIEHYPQLSSLMIADTRGREHMLLSIEPPAGSNQARHWRCRRARPDEWGDQVEWIEWIDDQPKETRKAQLNYDPRSRPWFEGALKRHKITSQRELTSLIHWTAPYVFFTTKDLGITASLCFEDAQGKQNVIGFDILLQDISRFTVNQRPTENGKLLVLTSEGTIVGLPGSATQSTDPGDWKKSFLKKPAELGFNITAEALNHLSFEVQRDQSKKVNSQGRQWWVGMRPFKLGTDLKLWILVLIPDLDLRSTLELE